MVVVVVVIFGSAMFLQKYKSSNVTHFSMVEDLYAKQLSVQVNLPITSINPSVEPSFLPSVSPTTSSNKSSSCNQTPSLNQVQVILIPNTSM